MKTIRTIKISLIKIFTSVGFYLCVLFTVVLCFTGEVYYDFTKNEAYSVIGCLAEFEREEMLFDMNFCSYYVSTNAFYGYMSLFLPIIAAFPFVPLMCDEFEHNAIRTSVVRLSRISYSSGKFIASVISGGLAVMLGFAVFCGLVILLFPDITDFNSGFISLFINDVQNKYSYLTIKNTVLLLIPDVIGAFVSGFFAAVPAAVLCSIIRNKYLVMCIPFFIRYLVSQLSVRLMFISIEDPELSGVYLDFVSLINPDSIGGIPTLNDFAVKTLIFYLALSFVAFTAYMIVSCKRRDCGE